MGIFFFCRRERLLSLLLSGIILVSFVISLKFWIEVETISIASKGILNLLGRGKIYSLRQFQIEIE